MRELTKKRRFQINISSPRLVLTPRHSFVPFWGNGMITHCWCRMLAMPSGHSLVVDGKGWGTRVITINLIYSCDLKQATNDERYWKVDEYRSLKFYTEGWHVRCFQADHHCRKSFQRCQGHSGTVPASNLAQVARFRPRPTLVGQNANSQGLPRFGSAFCQTCRKVRFERPPCCNVTWHISGWAPRALGCCSSLKFIGSSRQGHRIKYSKDIMKAASSMFWCFRSGC